LDTRPGEWRRVDDGKPSLWLPRFDRVVSSRGLERLAVESFYSLADITTPGATATHQTFLGALEAALDRRDQRGTMASIVLEYLCRDFLDVVMGNSDNHGRNRAVLRGPELQLAPIYDLAPMVMDPEGVTRSTHWGPHERAGRVDWLGVCGELERWTSAGEPEACLRDFGARLSILPERLRDAGLSEEVMSFPRIFVGRLDDVLREWGLR